MHALCSFSVSRVCGSTYIICPIHKLWAACLCMFVFLHVCLCRAIRKRTNATLVESKLFKTLRVQHLKSECGCLIYIYLHFYKHRFKVCMYVYIYIYIYIYACMHAHIQPVPCNSIVSIVHSHTCTCVYVYIHDTCNTTVSMISQ